MFSVLAVSFAFTYLMTPWLIPRLVKAGIVGRDMNKSGNRKLPEMGGLAIVGGFVVGVLLAIALTTFNLIDVSMNLSFVLACLSTVLVMALIGIIDDLFLMSQRVKALLPVFAALPLVAVKAGVTSMDLPVFGTVDFGLLYPLVLIPIAITGASNATNMLAGFNGLEAGLGIVMCSTVGLVSFMLGRTEATVVSFAMLGALLAFLRYNWNPARILIGDVGTLTVGAVVAGSVIIGNIEKVGVILIAPFFLELALKAKSGFKAESWCKVEGEKLVCPRKDMVFGMGRLVMYLRGGVSEQALVVALIAFEAVFALAALYSVHTVLLV